MRSYPSLRLTVLCVTAALGAACAPISNDTLSFSDPAPVDRSAVDLGPGVPNDALNMAASKLRAAGFRIRGIDRRTGTIQAVSRNRSLVSCGTVTQTADGTTARFPGTAPRSVIFDENQPGGIYLREVETTSAVAVQIRPGADTNQAAIGERHKVRIRQFTPTRSNRIGEEVKEFAYGGTADFADGTTCGSSGAVRAILN